MTTFVWSPSPGVWTGPADWTPAETPNAVAAQTYGNVQGAYTVTVTLTVDAAVALVADAVPAAALAHVETLDRPFVGRSALRGMVVGILLAIPLWGALALIVFWLLRSH
jgi:hypothetical protein